MKVSGLRMVLIAEAERRYEKDSVVDSLGFSKNVNVYPINYGYDYYTNINCLRTHDYCLLFDNGKWATIIDQPKEIDWSVAGQLVRLQSNYSKYIFITSGEYDNSLGRFTGTCMSTDGDDCNIGSICDDLPQNLYKLYTEPFTINPSK